MPRTLSFMRRSISSIASSLDQGLADRKCLITGASRGIGLAIAQRFAAEGASCIIVGRNKDTLSAAFEGLEATGSTRHGVRVGDVRQRSFWEKLAKEESDISLLVNAAGISHSSLLLATKPQLVEDVVSTNLMATIWACQLLVKGMIRRRDGCIINISSLLGVKGGRGSTAYAASKAGMIGLTRSLSAEVGTSGIRINAILPGYIETQMTENMSPEARSRALQAIPLNRFGRAEEVADAAAFLAKNAYASNCVLNLDGGLSST